MKLAIAALALFATSAAAQPFPHPQTAPSPTVLKEAWVIVYNNNATASGLWFTTESSCKSFLKQLADADLSGYCLKATDMIVP